MRVRIGHVKMTLETKLIIPENYYSASYALFASLSYVQCAIYSVEML